MADLTAPVPADTLLSDYSIIIKLQGQGTLTTENVTSGFSKYGEIAEVFVFSSQRSAKVAFKNPQVASDLAEKGELYIPPTYKLKVNRAQLTHAADIDRELILKYGKPVSSSKQLSVTCKHDSKTPVPPRVNAQIDCSLTVRNSSAQPMELRRISFRPSASFRVNTKKDILRSIVAGQPFVVPVQFNQTTGLPGLYTHQIAFHFGPEKIIVYTIEVNVTNPDTEKLLKAAAPYVEKKELQLPSKIMPAPPPVRGSTTHFHTPTETDYKEPLEQYEMPKEVEGSVMASDTAEMNPWKLKPNYRQRLHKLLFIEEAATQKKMHRYDLEQVLVQKVHPGSLNTVMRPGQQEIFSRIEVPGLAERRPSVLPGDNVIVWQPEHLENPGYEGWVYRIEESAIVVRLHDAFHELYPPEARFAVRFTLNRYPFRLMHRSVDAVDLDVAWPDVAPSSILSVEPTVAPDFAYFDKAISQNPEQSKALCNLLARTSQTASYLIFGPFGCGKTRLLIEYVRQVLRQPNSRVLLCAHSNSATDKFVEELSAFELLKPNEIFRLVAFHRKPASVSEGALRFTLYNHEKQIFDVPPLEKLKSYRVICTTIPNTSTLYGVGVGRQHFTHIVMDEVAQLNEPEGLMPLCLATKHTAIVMAGDDKQVGPKVQSRVTEHHGLHMSLLERMSTLAFYANRKDPRFCMKLIRNYRNHERIVALLSKLFYDNQLKSLAAPSITNKLQTWKKMGTNQSFPMLFYSLHGGKDEREADSPAYFNIKEAEAIDILVSDLLGSTRGLIPDDVAVICPSPKQSEKLRQLLRLRKLSGVKVASTEEFHGNEFKAVFISTVQASASLYEHNRMHNIGFVQDVRRLNTAISRAICLLVMVGDERILMKSPEWREIIQTCKLNGAYLSTDAQPDENDAVSANGAETATPTVPSPAVAHHQSPPQQHQQAPPQQRSSAAGVPHVPKPAATAAPFTATSPATAPLHAHPQTTPAASVPTPVAVVQKQPPPTANHGVIARPPSSAPAVPQQQQQPQPQQQQQQQQQAAHSTTAHQPQQSLMSQIATQQVQSQAQTGHTSVPRFKAAAADFVPRGVAEWPTTTPATAATAAAPPASIGDGFVESASEVNEFAPLWRNPQDAHDYIWWRKNATLNPPPTIVFQAVVSSGPRLIFELSLFGLKCSVQQKMGYQLFVSVFLDLSRMQNSLHFIPAAQAVRQNIARPSGRFMFVIPEHMQLEAVTESEHRLQIVFAPREALVTLMPTRVEDRVRAVHYLSQQNQSPNQPT